MKKILFLFLLVVIASCTGKNSSNNDGNVDRSASEKTETVSQPEIDSISLLLGGATNRGEVAVNYIEVDADSLGKVFLSKDCTIQLLRNGHDEMEKIYGCEFPFFTQKAQLFTDYNENGRLLLQCQISPVGGMDAPNDPIFLIDTKTKTAKFICLRSKLFNFGDKILLIENGEGDSNYYLNLIFIDPKTGEKRQTINNVSDKITRMFQQVTATNECMYTKVISAYQDEVTNEIKVVLKNQHNAMFGHCGNSNCTFDKWGPYELVIDLRRPNAFYFEGIPSSYPQKRY